MEPLNLSSGGDGDEGGSMPNVQVEDEEEREDERREAEVEVRLVRVLADDQVRLDRRQARGVPNMAAL